MNPEINPGASRNASIHPDLDPAIQARIDAALAQVGSATPRSGLEGRIAAHLSFAQERSTPAESYRGVSWFSPRRMAALAGAGAFAALVIVTGSVAHSRHVLPVAPGNTVAARPAASTGMQAADKVVEAPKPVAAPTHGRARAVHKDTAEASDAQSANTQPSTNTKPGAIAAPKTPMPAAQKNQ
ncbi:hypothetical protein [Silvibacterium sp.]|uniref:hypothetical protein n=1 Tax=Silvibacterium sp. TaxID=1964179 RepID=UPI0039E3D7C5